MRTLLSYRGYARNTIDCTPLSLSSRHSIQGRVCCAKPFRVCHALRASACKAERVSDHTQSAAMRGRARAWWGSSSVLSRAEVLEVGSRL